MKAVLDVGQYVSAIISPQGHPAQIIRYWRDGTFELLSSQPILDDLRRVLFYPHIRKHLIQSDQEIHAFVDSLAIACRLTPSARAIHVVQDDPEDDKILLCALEGHADYVVSSDSHLVSLGSFRDISIITPHQFLLVLKQKRLER